jgi:hypothetical protein
LRPSQSGFCSAGSVAGEVRVDAIETVVPAMLAQEVPIVDQSSPAARCSLRHGPNVTASNEVSTWLLPCESMRRARVRIKPPLGQRAPCPLGTGIAEVDHEYSGLVSLPLITNGLVPVHASPNWTQLLSSDNTDDGVFSTSSTTCSLG